MSHTLTQPIELVGRELILQEAARLFTRQGYNGISMREIAEACQMTKAALYYHFTNKQDLLREILKTYLTSMQQQLAQAKESSGSVRQRIHSVVHAIFDQNPQQRAVIHLIFVDAPHLEENLRGEIGCLYHDQFLGVLETILQEGIDHNEIVPVDPRLSAQLLLGMMYPFFHPRRALTSEETLAAVELMLKIFFEGVETR
jgi:AcrR family transcriptional regulator